MQNEAKKQWEMGDFMSDSRKVNSKISKNSLVIDHDFFAKKLNKSNYWVRIFECVGIDRRNDFEKRRPICLTVPELLNEIYCSVRSSIYSALDEFCDAGLLLKQKKEGDFGNKYIVQHHDDWFKIAKLRLEFLQRRYDEKKNFLKVEEQKSTIVEEKIESAEQTISEKKPDEGDETNGTNNNKN